jgi:hypothetical protein
MKNENSGLTSGGQFPGSPGVEQGLGTNQHMPSFKRVGSIRHAVKAEKNTELANFLLEPQLFLCLKNSIFMNRLYYFYLSQSPLMP